MAKVHNLAYDFSDAEEDLQVNRKIEHKKNTAASSKKFSTLKFVVMCTVVCGLLCAMIYGKVEISSLCSQQTQLQTQLTQLQSDNVSLESELAQKTSMTKVEEYAENELGLKKLDKSQIEYVEVDNGAIASVVKTDDQSVFVKIKNWFGSVLEYIGL